MKNILIADSGSTKTEWSILTDTQTQMISTQGISPYFLKTNQISSLLQQELLPKISGPANISEVYYYGTGCTAPGNIRIIHDALATLFPIADIHITYDLIAAAHALCGHNKGIACILGTGSNSCYWNGEDVERNNPGLGYILGDEGSGAHLGKLVIAAYLYGKLDAALEQEFERRFSIDQDMLLTKVYSTALPNRYLASFSIFFAEHRGQPKLEILLKEGLESFFKVHLMTYDESLMVPVHFTGSVAWGYRDVLAELCNGYGLQLGKIVKEPMKELVDYYRVNDITLR